MRVKGFFLSLTTLLLLCGCGSPAADGVAASVDGYIITNAELDRYYHSQDIDSPGLPTQDEERTLRLNLLRELIDRQILLGRAERLGLLAVDAEVDKRFEDYRSPYGTGDQFREHLREQNLTVGQLRNELRRTLTVEKLFQREIRSKLSVEEAEMRAYYEQNKARFHVPEQQVHVAWIRVTAAKETPVPNRRNDDATGMEEARRKIDMIEARLRNGEEFSVLAQDYSEDPVSTASGGDIGFFPQSSLEQIDLTLRRVVASLAPGEISPVLRSGQEYQIVKLFSREEAGQRQYSDPRVQQSVRDTLMNKKDRLLRAAYLEMARNQAKIENYLAREVLLDFGVPD